ncbi:MAG: hypothetical protein ABL901_19490 [Hyphomicrobiaceae bacterium]
MKIAAVLLASLLSTCDPVPPVTIVTPAPKPLVVAPECDPTHDPRWTNLPDADVRRRQAARIVEHNGDAFDDVTGARAVCWASLKNRVTTGATPNQPESQ